MLFAKSKQTYSKQRNYLNNFSNWTNSQKAERIKKNQTKKKPKLNV